MVGNGWHIYIDGEISADAADKLQSYVSANDIPYTSTVILNSLGGNLVGGIELGRSIRELGFSTDIGTKRVDADGIRGYDPGKCFSSCALAYLGGQFRYLRTDSRYGIHRFYFSKPTGNEADIAQLLSAMVVTYLKDMGVDTELFALTTKAGPEEMLEPDRRTLDLLGVINNGFEKARWTIEATTEVLYLKGERETVYGINKFIVLCAHGSPIYLMAIFDPQGRHEESLNLGAHSIVIDGIDTPIDATETAIRNGWFNGSYILSESEIDRIRNADSVGVIIRSSYNSPIFLGFNNMEFGPASAKFDGLLSSCRS